MFKIKIKYNDGINVDSTTKVENILSPIISQLENKIIPELVSDVYKYKNISIDISIRGRCKKKSSIVC